MPDYYFDGTIDSDGTLHGTLREMGDYGDGSGAGGTAFACVFMGIIYLLCLIGGIFMLCRVHGAGDLYVLSDLFPQYCGKTARE